MKYELISFSIIFFYVVQSLGDTSCKTEQNPIVFVGNYRV